MCSAIIVHQKRGECQCDCASSNQRKCRCCFSMCCAVSANQRYSKVFPTDSRRPYRPSRLTRYKCPHGMEAKRGFCRRCLKFSSAGQVSAVRPGHDDGNLSCRCCRSFASGLWRNLHCRSSSEVCSAKLLSGRRLWCEPFLKAAPPHVLSTGRLSAKSSGKRGKAAVVVRCAVQPNSDCREVFCPLCSLHT